MKCKMMAVAAALAFLAGLNMAVAQITPPAGTPPTTTPTNAPAGRQRGNGAAGGRAVDVPDPNAPETKYDYHELWKPFYYTKNGTEYRAADGQPGPKYWQNRADYKLSATLHDDINEVVGSEILTYTNNSPQKLGFIWMQLDQNLFKLDSRGNKQVGLNAAGLQQSRNWGRGQVFDAGYKIKSVKILSTAKGS